MQWNQIYRSKRDQSHPELGLITLATTLSLWRGFQMTPPVLTIPRLIENPPKNACLRERTGFDWYV